MAKMPSVQGKKSLVRSRKQMMRGGQRIEHAKRSSSSKRNRDFVPSKSTRHLIQKKKRVLAIFLDGVDFCACRFNGSCTYVCTIRANFGLPPNQELPVKGSRYGARASSI